MDEATIRKLFPHASASLFKANKADRDAKGAKPERVVRNEQMEKASRKESDSIRRQVRIVSFRQRLLDIDNLYGGVKYFVDSLRYAGLIRNDDPESISLIVSQVKVKTKQEERTEIEIA